MFKKLIIYLKREKLVASLVNTKDKSVIKTIELGWNKETLGIALGKIKEEFKINKVRILFAEDVSYLLKVSVPDDIPKDNEKEYLKAKILQEIPEILENGDWDYKRIGNAKRDYIVFSPIKEILQSVKEAVGESALEIQAIEPEQVAVTRHINPIIGIALKNDLTGKDEDVLNLSISKKNVPEIENNKGDSGSGNAVFENEGNGNPKKLKTIIMTVIMVFLILGIWTFGYYYFFASNKKVNIVPQEKQNLSDKTEIQISPTPTPEVTISIHQYKIQVQNGSGINGKARQVADVLNEAGFENIQTTNASVSANLQSKVYLNFGTPDILFNKIEEVLADNYELVFENADLSEFDAIIILGNSKK